MDRPDARAARASAKKKATAGGGLEILAEWTGLEPATPGVTGRYSNQLNYHSNGAGSVLAIATGAA